MSPGISCYGERKKGMWFELGMAVCVGMSCTTANLRRGDFLDLVAGCSIANVIPGMLCLVVCWCVRGAVWTITGAVVFLRSDWWG